MRFAPCPFCGEPEMLIANGSMCRLVFTASGEIATDARGEALEEDVEAISCLMCDAMAPVDIWNRRADPHPNRDAMAAYYRDDPDFARVFPALAKAREGAAPHPAQAPAVAA